MCVCVCERESERDKYIETGRESEKNRYIVRKSVLQFYKKKVYLTLNGHFHFQFFYYSLQRFTTI